MQGMIMNNRVLKILCVEDNPEDALLLERMLKQSSMLTELVCVARFEQARERLAEGDFEIILLDLSLPDAQGYETVTRMRSLAPHIPVVVLTGLMDESVGIRCVQAGAQDYLVKGKFDEGLLRRVLSYAVERQRAEHELVSHREHLQELVRERTAELAEARDVALESARLKAEFMSNMSHEIRTPMNAVIGMTELLMTTELTPTQRNYGKVVQSAGESLLRIINDILDFSKIESEKLALENETFNFPAAIDNIVKLLAHQANPKGITLLSEIQDAIPESLCGDVGRLQQVVVNLAGNAIKFTERGEVRIHVSTVKDMGLKIMLCFKISDTGIGLSEEGKRHLFQPFSQADSSITRKFGGTGLGLAISKKIVELMGGEMGVESTFGKGSTFWFTVPLAKGIMGLNKGSSISEKVVPASPTPVREGVRILVVDDNEFNRILAQEQLAKLGFQSEVAIHGMDALRALGSVEYPVVLMDCQMPELDGYQATREIRRREANGALHTTVIAMTANVLEKDRQKCLEAGMDDCLVKPVKMENLKTILDRWLPAPEVAPKTEPLPAAPVPGPASQNPVDLEVLKEATEGNAKAMERLTVTYFEQAAGHLQHLQAAIEKGATKEVESYAHSLAGSSVCFGAIGMVPLLRDIEHMAEDQQLETAPEVFDKVMQEFERVKNFMALNPR